MSTILWLALFAGLGLALALGLIWVLWRGGSDQDRDLVKRISRLSFRAKLRLARAMFGDRRIPLGVRLIPALLVLYLAMPLDIVPDFIPVLGQLDDVLIVAVGVGLLFRLTRREVIEEHVSLLEGKA